MRHTHLIPYSALFIALIAAFSFISIPFFPVPLTLQTLAVLLAGAVMKRYAVYPVTLYIILGILGLPVFHNGMAGIGMLFGPTGGYIIGFIPAVCIVGICYERSTIARAFGLVSGTLIIYLFGISWLIVSTGMDPYAAVLVGLIPFLPGDLIKAFLCFLIAKKIETAGFTLSGRPT